jgi:hypothetical protein
VTRIGGAGGIRRRSTHAIVLAAGLLAGCQGSPGASSQPPGFAPPVGSLGTGASGHAAAGSCHVVDGRADVRCTPGATNPEVTQTSIGTTICVPGWTAKVRPPVAFTNLLKTSQMIEYGETGPPSDFEEDHLINLGIGGAPQDPHNLFPQPRTGPRSASMKDQEETQLQRDVCSGRTTLATAQAQILADWTHS